MVLLGLAALACRSGSSRRAGGDDAGTGNARVRPQPPPTRVADLPTVTPDWQRAVPATPGLAVIERVTGPVLGARVAIVGSTAIGFAGLDVTTGEVRWQRRGERKPGLPAARDGQAWLPGPCAHVTDDRPDGYAAGCVEVIGANGALARRVWITPRGGPVSSLRNRALGWSGERLFWLHGRDVTRVSMTGDPATYYSMPDGVEVGPWGWAAWADRVGIASRDRLMVFVEPRSDRAQHGPRWVASAARAPGVVGPIAAGDRVIWSHDGHVEAHVNGARVWRAQGSYAYAPGSLAARAGAVRAVRIDSGIQPVLLDAETGRISVTGQRAPGVHVLAVAGGERGFAVAGGERGSAVTGGERGFAVAVRMDGTLRKDVVVAYDSRLRIRWAWPIPEPQTPRLDPVGLAATADAVFVFRDGRYVARLPL